MMVNNAGDVFVNFALAQKENTSFIVDMRVIFHINDILNDSLQKFLMQVNEKTYNACTSLHVGLLPLQYSNVCLSRQWASLYSDRFYFQNANVHADAFSSPKQTILQRYQIEINKVNQLPLNQSTKVNLLISGFMKSSRVITIKLNTLTDVPYQMTKRSRQRF